MKEKDVIRIGICGTGSFGRARAKAFKAAEGAEVALGWSRSAASRERFSSEIGAPAVPQWRRLCASPDVDAVVVSSINVDHYTHARASLEAGKHVLIETPLSLSAAQAGALAELAREKGRVLHHGAKRRYHPDSAAHVDELRRIGLLLYAVDHNSFDGGPERPWYGDPNLTGGARAFLPYAMLNWLEAFGEVRRATGAESTAALWSAATVTMSFERGGCATISYTLGAGVPALTMSLAVGTEGAIETAADGTRVFVQGESRTQLRRREVDVALCECEAFLDEIRGLRPYQADLELDLRALALVDEALGQADIPSAH